MESPRVSRYRIVSRIEKAKDHVELILEAPVLARAVPGQFVHVRTPGTLRRPISFSRLNPVRGEAGLLFQVVGPGTAWLAGREPGDWLDVLGPLGQGFPRPEPERPWCLVGGGVGIPPLYAALTAWQNDVTSSIDAILGARSQDYLIMLEDFGAQIDHPIAVTTDDGSVGAQGTVLGPLAHWHARHPTGQVYACGPMPMLAAVARLMQTSGVAYLALEQRMGCGVGACLACVVMANGPEGPRWRRVCYDGPVFRAEELIWS